MSQALQTQGEARRTPTTIAMGLRPQLAETLPKHIDADAFSRTIQTALQVQPELLDCTPRSLMIACMRAATDGLILDGREAALIVRSVKVSKNPDVWEKQATYQPMVQGLMKLARNSGEIISIIAHVVYEHDKFHYVLGDEERIDHEPAPFDADQGRPIAVYAIVKLKDGTSVREVMRGSAVMNIAGQGKNAWQYDPAKGQNFAEWWRKTVIRRIVKYIPRSSDAVGKFAQAVERIDEDFEFGADPIAEPAAAPTGKKRGAGAALLKNITPKEQAKDRPGIRQDEPEPVQENDFDPDTGEVYDDEQTAEDDI